MDSAFGIDHGEVSKAFGIPKPKMPSLNRGARSKPFGSTAAQTIKTNLKPIAAGAGAGAAGGAAGFSLSRRNKQPTQPRSL